MPGRNDLYAALRDQGPLTRTEVKSALYGPGGDPDNWRRSHLDGLVAVGAMHEGSASHFGWEDEVTRFGFGAGIGCVLAVAASTRRIRVGIVDANLCLVGDAEEAISDAFVSEASEFEQVLAFTKDISKAIKSVLRRQAPETIDAIKAVGVALPLAVHHSRGEITDDTARHSPVARHLLDAWPTSPRPSLKAFVWDTDVAAAGLGYTLMHRDVPDLRLHNVLVVKVSATIRHAFFVDGKLVRGASSRGHALGKLRVATSVTSRIEPPHPVLDDFASLHGLRANVMPAYNASDSLADWSQRFYLAVERGRRLLALRHGGVDVAAIESDIGVNQDRWPVLEAAADAADQSAFLIGQAVKDVLRIVDPDSILLTGDVVRQLGGDYVDVLEGAADLGDRDLLWKVARRPTVQPFLTLTGIAATAFRERVFPSHEAEHLELFRRAPGRRKASKGADETPDPPLSADVDLI